MATTSVMGGSVRRREDPALIQGYGEYVDDLTRTGMLHVAFLRSPVARAKITKLDTSAAKEMTGVDRRSTPTTTWPISARCSRRCRSASCGRCSPPVR